MHLAGDEGTQGNVGLSRGRFSRFLTAAAGQAGVGIPRN